MTSIERFNRERIKCYLQARDLRYLTDSDGDFQVGFGYSEKTGCRLSIDLQAGEVNVGKFEVQHVRRIVHG